MEQPDIITLLHEGNYSCVMQHGEEVRTFSRRGIIDLYELFEKDKAFMRNAALADKVIGKGAALLLVLGGIGRVYADVISTPALTVLQQAHIPTSYSQEVPFIINRQGTGHCPLETACARIDSPEAAYPVIQDFVRKMFP